MAARPWTAYAWAAPWTLLGLVVVAAARARCVVCDGIVEAHGPGIVRGFALAAPGRSILAMTLGHVVLGRDARALADTRAHERVHVAQYERWGPAFVPVYLAASVVVWLRGGDAYGENPFEREAWAVAPVPDGSAPVAARRD